MNKTSSKDLKKSETLCQSILFAAVISVSPSCWSAGGVTPPLSLKTGQAISVALPESVQRIALADPSVADVNLINMHEMYVLGKRSGKTNLILWTGSQKTQSIDIEVGFDTRPLQSAFQRYFPEETTLRVLPLGNTLVLNGTVSDSLKAHQIVLLSRAFLQTQEHSEAIPVRSDSSIYPMRHDEHGLNKGALVQAFDNNGTGKLAPPTQLINLLRISAPQQVRLDVKVAEVSKTWLQQWGVKVGLNINQGEWSAALGSALSNSSAPASLAIGLTSGEAAVSVTAQTQDSLIKTLAEPSLLAISGQQASFLAGGKVFIPVVQSTAQGAPLSSLEEKEFGIALKFTPTVLDGGRIHLKVAPEVSELNPQGLGLAATGVSGQAILPLFTTRRASTAVELRDGESFAIGGLMQNNVNSSIQAVPWLADIPILGALFRSSQFQKDQTELLFVVTPHLLSPSDTRLSLPTDHYSEPSAQGFFLEGKQQDEANISSYADTIPEGHPADLSRPGMRTEASTALRSFDRYQNDEGAPLPLMGLPRSSALMSMPQ